MRFVSRMLTRQGVGRNNNEDSCRVNDELGLWMVADGMGGHQAGEVASALAAAIVESEIASYVAACDGVKNPGVSPVITLKAAIARANETVMAHSRKNDVQTLMGSTLTVAWYRQGALYIGQVGDSRAYFLGAVAGCLTEDHTVANELLRKGEITAEEAESHPRKHMLTRAIGAETEVDPDILVCEWPQGSVLLLCTDGLYNGCDPQTVAVAGPLDDILLHMAESSAAAGSQDDMTGVIVVCYDDENADTEVKEAR